jgi:hypothetical protein
LVLQKLAETGEVEEPVARFSRLGAGLDPHLLDVSASYSDTDAEHFRVAGFDG